MLLLGFLAAAAPPWLQGQIIETQTFTTNRVVPDGNASGLHDVRSVSSSIGSITSVKVNLKVNGEFNGDLYGYVRHSSGFSVLLNRPGRTAANPAGYDDSGLNVTFASGAANGDIHTYRSVSTPAAGSALTGSSTSRCFRTEEVVTFAVQKQRRTAQGAARPSALVNKASI